MNYQPFLEMNILVSDQLLAEIHRIWPEFLPAFIALLIATFYLLMFLHISLFRLYQVLRQPKKRHYSTV